MDQMEWDLVPFTFIDLEAALQEYLREQASEVRSGPTLVGFRRLENRCPQCGSLHMRDGVGARGHQK